MLKWTIIFFVLALVAALAGFGMAAGVAAHAAKLLFIGFLVLAVINIIAEHTWRKNA